MIKYFRIYDLYISNYYSLPSILGFLVLPHKMLQNLSFILEEQNFSNHVDQSNVSFSFLNANY